MNYDQQMKALRDRRNRDRDMRKMHDAGASHASIARKHGVSRERVAHIVREAAKVRRNHVRPSTCMLIIAYLCTA